jgi:hypothetical protein
MKVTGTPAILSGIGTGSGPFILKCKVTSWEQWNSDGDQRVEFRPSDLGANFTENINYQDPGLRIDNYLILD